MTLCIENETEHKFKFDIREIGEKVILGVLDHEECPYEVQVNLLVTDDATIHQINLEHRQIDRETDVLSFPNLVFDEPGCFDLVEDMAADCCDPETDEVILGDIIINYKRVISQALEYGHSELREFAFLVAHSMFHLCGYDHMTEEEAKDMEERQEEVLASLGITREI